MNENKSSIGIFKLTHNAQLNSSWYHKSQSLRLMVHLVSFASRNQDLKKEFFLWLHLPSYACDHEIQLISTTGS